MTLYLPSKIKRIIGNRPYSRETIGMSDSQVFYFDNLVLKVEKESEESNNEHKMMIWLAGKLPVPQIICFEKTNGMNYLLMSKVEGQMACSVELLANPHKLVRLLATGLKMLWGIDVSECPSNNSVENKLRLAEVRVLKGLCSVDDAEPTTYGTGGFKCPKDLFEWLKNNKPKEKFVLSHGDYCLPNIFVKDDKVNGFIDLGRSGVADIYQDIALCYRSLQHNYNGTYGGKVDEGFDAEILFEALEIKPNWDKIRFYILLDELF